MGNLRIVVGMLLALMALDVMSAAANAAGAIAVGRCSRNGYSFNHPSEGAAAGRALAECRKNGDGSCKVVVRINRACAAFAISGSDGCGARGWAYAPSRSTAETMAVGECAKRGGARCRVQAWVCDGG